MASCATKPQAASSLPPGSRRRCSRACGWPRSITRCASRPPSLGAYDLALRAMPGVLSLDADGNARALELLERALERDPGPSARDRAGRLGACSACGLSFHLRRRRQERARSLELAHKARTLRDDATVLAVLGNALTLLNEFDAADLVIRKALADRRRIGLGLEPQRMDRRLPGRSGIRHRALQDRARPRAARSARLQQHGRDRLRAISTPANMPRRRAGRSGR